MSASCAAIVVFPSPFPGLVMAIVRTTLPVARVAGQVGYDELAYFSRRYRQETGLAPRQYRRQRQEEDFRLRV